MNPAKRQTSDPGCEGRIADLVRNVAGRMEIVEVLLPVARHVSDRHIVAKARLRDDRTVAVKVFGGGARGGGELSEFRTELAALQRLRSLGCAVPDLWHDDGLCPHGAW